VKLESIHLVNVCQHVDTRLTFDYGVTGIFGHNGCGKSNLLKMMKASLTGDFTSNAGVKSDNIRYGCRTAPAYVEATWLHANSVFTVVRGLQDAATYLKIHNKQGQVTGVSDINAAIESLLGLPGKIIDGFIFVDQWKMFEFLSSRPADRARTFAHLCNTFAAERLWKLLSGMVSSHRPVDYQEELRQLRCELKEIRSKISYNEKELKAGKALMLADSTAAEYSAKLEQYAAKAKLTVQLVKSRKLLAEYEDKHKQAADKQAVLSGEYEATAQTLNELRRRYSRLDATAYQQQAAYADRLRALSEKLAVLEQTDLPAEPSPIDVAAETCHRKIAAAQVRLDQHRQYLNLAEDPAAPKKCPLCTAKIDVTEEELNRRRVLIEQNDKMIQHFERKLEQIAAHEKLARIRENRCRELETEKAAVQQGILELQQRIDQNWQPCDDREAEIRSLSAQIESIEPTLDDLAVQLQEAGNECNQLEGAIRAKKAEIEHLRSEAAKISVTKSEAAKYSEQLRGHTQASTSVVVLEERAEHLEQRRKEAASRLLLLDTKQKKQQKVAEWMTDIARWRDVVHRDNLPRLMANSLLERLVTEVNTNLEDFGNPFHVEASDDLSFIACKPKGFKEPASRLSGGEKILLAVAFRFAVNSIFAADAGMLVLDEPSAGLDTHNIDCFADIIERILAATQARQQQIIIVTHDERLSRAIPAAINLPDVMSKVV